MRSTMMADGDGSLDLEEEALSSLDPNEAANPVGESSPPQARLPPGPPRRRSGFQNMDAHQTGLYGDVWEHVDGAWKMTHQFNQGLELDAPSLESSRGAKRRLHLPSTSLDALRMLRSALQQPNAVALDVRSNGGGFESLMDALQRQVSGMLSSAGNHDLRSKLEERSDLCRSAVMRDPLVEEDDDGDLQRGTSEVIIGPEAKQEAIDVSVCSLANFDPIRPPAVAFARLAAPIELSGQTKGSAPVAVRYAALVLCAAFNADAQHLASQIACALAATFMDEDFARAMRAVPGDQPSGVVKALDDCLSELKLVPTVYMDRQSSKEEDPTNSQTEKDMLSVSIVNNMEKHLCDMRGLQPEGASSKDLELTLPAEPMHGRRPKLKQRRAFFVEVSRLDPSADDQNGGALVSTHCLRKGLEVDMASSTARPHIPCVSVAALEQARALITPSSVALDVSADMPESAVTSITDLLSLAGLPEIAMVDIKRHLLYCARDKSGAHLGFKDNLFANYNEVLRPSADDEACHVVAVSHSQVPKHLGTVGAFVRFSRPMADTSLSASGAPVRFLFVLVGPPPPPGERKRQSRYSDGKEGGDFSPRDEVSALSQSMAALAVDEDLMGTLASVVDVSSFIAAIDERLGDLVFLPHAHVHNKPQYAGPNFMGTLGHTAGSTTEPLCVKLPNEVVSKGHAPHARDDDALHHDHSSRPQAGWRGMLRKTVQLMQKYSLPLVVGVTLALFWSNVDEHSYHDFTHLDLVPGVKVKDYDLTLHFIVNDIFMVFFFGLAIKEVTEAVLPGGSLSPFSRAVNPLMATVGGVLGPVAAYIIMILAFDAAGAFDGAECIRATGGASSGASSTSGASGSSGSGVLEACPLGEFIRGWGVPTATDISLAWMFALLIFGVGHPAINYLLLLAIVDDALGMVIIAVFYTPPDKQVEPVYLLLVIAAMALAAIMRFFKVPYWSLYIFICGPISWYGLLSAHVHPALALVFVVPFMQASHAAPKRRSDERHLGTGRTLGNLTRSITGFMTPSGGGGTFRRAATRIAELIEDGMSNRKAEAVELAAKQLEHMASAPLHQFEHHLKQPVDMGMFFFGLANAGVPMGSVGAVTYSVVGALVLGKTLGIAACSLFASAIGFGLPAGVTIADLFAMSALGGVGLTVALFVANQAFVDPDLQGQAKMGAVISVACAGLAWALRVGLNACFGKADNASGVDVSQLSTTDSESDIGASQEEDEGEWLDEFVVEDILQAMWVQKKYQQRGVALKLTQDNVRAASKRSTLSVKSGGGSPRSARFGSRACSKDSFAGRSKAPQVGKANSGGPIPRSGRSDSNDSIVSIRSLEKSALR